MEVRLQESQEAWLHDLAVRTGRATDDLVSEAVAKLLAEDEWFGRQVQFGMDQIARGEFLEEEQVDEFVAAQDWR